ncbi:MAG: hypothetical protein VB089_22730 [Anaerolineaceae bacterium]|jgi:hypothetical protein|nr:hypothetical protein [Anaerolineaceae bacterium]
MAEKHWEILRVRYCDRAGCDVALEAQAVFPAEHLPEQSPRLLAHRCSRGQECMLFDKPMCTWSGSNPSYDPFVE